MLWLGESAVIDRGDWIVVAWAATAALLAWLSSRTAERGFQLGAAFFLGTGLISTLAARTPPTRFWEATAHPATGEDSTADIKISVEKK